MFETLGQKPAVVKFLCQAPVPGAYRCSRYPVQTKTRDKKQYQQYGGGWVEGICGGRCNFEELFLFVISSRKAKPELRKRDVVVVLARAFEMARYTG